jgi:hypothetical protein
MLCTQHVLHSIVESVLHLEQWLSINMVLNIPFVADLNLI